MSGQETYRVIESLSPGLMRRQLTEVAIALQHADPAGKVWLQQSGDQSNEQLSHTIHFAPLSARERVTWPLVQQLMVVPARWAAFNGVSGRNWRLLWTNHILPHPQPRRTSQAWLRYDHQALPFDLTMNEQWQTITAAQVPEALLPSKTWRDWLRLWN